MSRGPEQPDENVGFSDRLTRDQWKEVKDWWLKNIVPDSKDRTPAQILGMAGYLRANKKSAAELINSKLQGTIRLVIIGMAQPPAVDNLPTEIMDKVPNLNFIAVEARNPNDKTGAFGEDKEGQTTIDLGGGMKMDLPHQEAKRLYPGKYRDPNVRNTDYDSTVVAAKKRGVKVIYAMQGTTWREMSTLAAEEIGSYMQDHPDAHGVYLSSIYAALKWPGYTSEEEEKALDFARPLATSHMFSTDPRIDTSIRMPAYALDQQFPGQAYSMAQFVMPRGYGIEWKDLRSAVGTSRLQERFAIDNIPTSPFAVQRYLFRGAAELADIPDEELWKYFGTMAQAFFGPAKARWDKVLDGVIIYPSSEPLPKPKTEAEMKEAAIPVVAKILSQ